MHRINAVPGGWNPQAEGTIFFTQSPAPLVFLTAADTDIQTLAASVAKLPNDFPALRVANLLQLQQQITIDTYAEEVLERTKIIILRLLGGRSYWSYGLEVVQETVQRTGAALIVMPGDDAIDLNLIAHSTIPLAAANQVWRYFTEGGVENIVNALQFVTDVCLKTTYNPPAPKPVPRVGLYDWRGRGDKGDGGKAGIIFYRAHYLAGNTLPIDALCQALLERHIEPVPVFVSSLRDPEVQAELLPYFQPKDGESIMVLLNTTSFSLAQLETELRTASRPSSHTPNLWQQLDVPVLQVILSSGALEVWKSDFQGLSPRDIAMNVALPEVDGRIISRAVSFKAVKQWNPDLETQVVVYESVGDRVNFVADLAQAWVNLRSRPPQQRKVALILANYPSRDGRLANGVGLDTPASCVEILKALQIAGYQVEDLPLAGDELIQRLITGVTNDPEGRELRSVQQRVSLDEYQEYFATLPQDVQEGICSRWGFSFETNHGDTENTEKEGESCFSFPISGIQVGNVFVGIQPARGYDLDPGLNYHAPDLEPPHAYLAFYYWIRYHFGADAVVHVGKHGNLEWLPGKSVALSSNCYPEVALGAIPHLYPFIVNDPGEGAQAKRRAQAVIIDHLTPPMTRAELYGALQKLESLVDEYYEAQSLDPSRLPVISDRINKLVLEENLHQDLDLVNGSQLTINNQPSTINKIDGYLCELKEAQIRDGLHILGQCPQGQQLRDLIVAIARHPNSNRVGLTQAIALDWGLDFDPLTTDFSALLSEKSYQLIEGRRQEAEGRRPNSCRTVGDAVEVLEQHAADLVEQLIQESGGKEDTGTRGRGDTGNKEEKMPLCPRQSPQRGRPPHSAGSSAPLPLCLSASTLDWIRDRLLPALQHTCQEMTNLLRGLDGGYVASGPSGAPTRGRPEVLPTGRNFYSVDIRAIPTETAWDVGRKAAEALIECYSQEHGEYPKTLGLSVWGTSTMRTGGDDIAEALALLGVRPVWDGVSRRVVDFEILPLSFLGRPRVDVTLRISGFFRDAFPNLIDLFDRAVAAVAALDETPDQNPIAAQVCRETQFWQSAGLTQSQAQVRSLYRIFGSKPGAYGAGLQGLIEAQNWTDDEDLARAYINWSCYAYTTRHGDISPSPHLPISPSSLHGRAAPEAFEQRLRQMQIVLHNQDNREHDLLDSDDYYQFQGGLTVAVRSIQGKNPQTYFGDNSVAANPRVRQLREEIARVYRSRVVNPKWIASVMRHGYKGAFEMAATVDYLFAYDATAKCVEDYMYRGITEAYLFDPAVQEFVQQKNPWALRDMAERLLEAHHRNLWQVESEMVDKLRAIVHMAEAVIEGQALPPH